MLFALHTTIRIKIQICSAHHVFLLHFCRMGDQDSQLVKNCHHISHLIQLEINMDKDIIEQMDDIYRIEQLSENWDFVLKKTQSDQTKLA